MMGIDIYGTFWYNIDAKEFKNALKMGCSGYAIGFRNNESHTEVVYRYNDGYFLKLDFRVLQYDIH